MDLDLLFHSLEVVDVVDPVLLLQQHRVVSPCCHFQLLLAPTHKIFLSRVPSKMSATQKTCSQVFFGRRSVTLLARLG